MSSVLQQGRRALYVDIENLCCTGLPTSKAVIRAMQLCSLAVHDLDQDRLTVACNHKAASTVAFALNLSGAQLQRGSGPDGADNALLRVILDDLENGRVQRLIIGSGDGKFADVLAPYRSVIEELTFIGVTGSVSRSCEALGDHIFYLPRPVLTLAS